MSESLVEMAQRHIREGEERIARQKELMTELARDGHRDIILQQASEFLTQLEALQIEAEEHLATAIKLTQNDQEGAVPDLRVPAALPTGRIRQG